MGWIEVNINIKHKYKLKVRSNDKNILKNSPLMSWMKSLKVNLIIWMTFRSFSDELHKNWDKLSKIENLIAFCFAINSSIIDIDFNMIFAINGHLNELLIN
jgi:hypothetical protein